MSNAASNPKVPSRGVRLAGLMVAASLLPGCTYMGRDHVEVGAIPDDYRTNHPIVISEREQVVDVPVGPGDERLSDAQKTAVVGFMSNYDSTAAPVVQVLHPSGSANEYAAAKLSHEMFDLIAEAGAPRHKIVSVPYHVSDKDTSAPVRISFVALSASTDQCGRWPDDMLKTTENKHYANFGCSYQNNIAAQVANPADLLGPRKPTEIDAARRGETIATYEEDGPQLGNSEVDY